MADATLGESRQIDFDTGGGTDLIEISGIALPASGGGIVAGGFLETGSGSFGALGIGGATAHDAVDSGYPIKIGGKASIGGFSVSSSDRVDGWFTTKGALVTTIGTSGPGADAIPNTNVLGILSTPANNDALLGVLPFLFNGTTWDRPRSGGVTGMQGVSGDTAHDAVDAGNPQKIGGKASSTAPASVATGDRVDAWLGIKGAMVVSVADISFTDAVSNYGTLATTGGAAALLSTSGYVFNGTTWDRARSGGVTGMQGIAGATAADAAIAANPVTVGARASTAVPTPVSADGDVVDLRALRTGALTVHVVDASGNAASMGGGTQYVEDVAFGGNGTGTLMVARRDDALAVLTPVEDDAVGLRVNNRGALWVSLADTTGAQITTLPVSISALLDVNIDSASSSLAMTGDVVHDAVDAGDPVKIGGKASVENPTAVATSDRVDAHFDTKGRMGMFLTEFNGAAAAAVFAAQADDQILGTNSLAVSSFGYGYDGTTLDMLRTVEALSAAPNLDTGVLAVGHGPGFDRKTNPTGVAATSTSNAVEVLVNGADSVTFHVTTIGGTPGSMIFQTTADDSAWATAGAVIKLGSLETWIEGSFVPAVDDVYMVRTTGLRRVRYKVNAAYGSGTATVKVTSSIGSPVIKTVEMASAPHKIGYTMASATAQYTSAQTSTTIGPTISSSQRLVVTYLQIGAGGTVAATQCSVYFGTGAYSRGTSKAIFDHEFAPSATSKPGFAASPPMPWIGAADEELKITTVGAANPLTVTIWYYIVGA